MARPADRSKRPADAGKTRPVPPGRINAIFAKFKRLSRPKLEILLNESIVITPDESAQDALERMSLRTG